MQTDPMDAVIASPLYLGWALGLFATIASLMVWKWRRRYAERRINRGLRMYTASRQVVS